jgi:hypothetical protein
MSQFPLGPLPLSLFGLRFAQAGAPPPVFRCFSAPLGEACAVSFPSSDLRVRCQSKEHGLFPPDSNAGLFSSPEFCRAPQCSHSLPALLIRCWCHSVLCLDLFSQICCYRSGYESRFSFWFRGRIQHAWFSPFPLVDLLKFRFFVLLFIFAQQGLVFVCLDPHVQILSPPA